MWSANDMTNDAHLAPIKVAGSSQPGLNMLRGPALTLGGRILQIPYLCIMGEIRVRKAIVSANSSAVGSTIGASGGAWNTLDVISLPVRPSVMAESVYP